MVGLYVDRVSNILLCLHFDAFVFPLLKTISCAYDILICDITKYNYMFHLDMRAFISSPYPLTIGFFRIISLV